MTLFKATIAALSFSFIVTTSFSQHKIEEPACEQPATVVLFRTFNLFSFKFSFNLFSGDSLIGRIKTHDVFILKTHNPGISFQATTKAPSLNTGKKTDHQKRKTVKYPFSLMRGQVYFVKCDFLNQKLFDYPRQPTIRLMRKDEVAKYMRKRFLKRKIKMYLYNEWLVEKCIEK